VALLSLESVHRLGANREAKRVLGGLVQVVCVEGAEAERIRRQVERVGRGEVEGTEEEEKMQKKIQELRGKDVVKRERGAECVKGIAD
jgi:tetrahydromethanopterin S-methyltransferase subunit A